MTIEFEQTREDYIAAIRAMSRRTWWLLLVLWIGLVAFSCWTNRWAIAEHDRDALRRAAVPLIISAVAFLVMAWGGSWLRARRMILRKATHVISETGIDVTSDVSTSHIDWRALIEYRETPKVFLLFVQRGMASFIPKRVLTEEGIVELRALLAEHVGKS